MSDVNFGTNQDANVWPFGLSVARGVVPNMSGIQKFGYSPDVDGTQSVIWDATGVYAYPASAQPAEIVCASGDDVSTGTGARSIEIQGLDENYNLVTETVTLDNPDSAGIEGVTTNNFLRIFRALVKTAGSGATNAGDITVSVAGVDLALIPAGNGQTLQAVYTVPAGKRAYLVSINAGTAKEKEITLGLYARPLGGAFNVKAFNTFRAILNRDYQIFEVFDEKTDIELRATADATTQVSGGFELLLENK
jgi:hypothetical protein